MAVSAFSMLSMVFLDSSIHLLLSFYNLNRSVWLLHAFPKRIAGRAYCTVQPITINSMNFTLKWLGSQHKKRPVPRPATKDLPRGRPKPTAGQVVL